MSVAAGALPALSNTGRPADIRVSETELLAAATRVIHALGDQAWREQRDRHRDWWTMPTTERLRVLTYEAGYDDGYEQAVADIAAAWAAKDYFTGEAA